MDTPDKKSFLRQEVPKPTVLENEPMSGQWQDFSVKAMALAIRAAPSPHSESAAEFATMCASASSLKAALGRGLSVNRSSRNQNQLNTDWKSSWTNFPNLSAHH